MTPIQQHIAEIRKTLPESVRLVCVSKFHPEEELRQAYDCGERDFGESHVQELLRKQNALPADIRWHMIGHLQTNKVKQIVPFIHLIQSVDSMHLLEVINREAAKINRVVNVLLEVHVAREENKTGFTPDELAKAIAILPSLPFVQVQGIMGMATLTDDKDEIRRCFSLIRQLADSAPCLEVISMGMSHDYTLALEEGSNMVRIGTTIFGQRNYLRN
ncbi:MAG: YggS family pyridoxal phosphate-dependent enzyme [Paludibacteraceae bacterium]|nr:YggS family pyridoxal phosphate-dependent enzyme [Paludibacteraceae bacterium]